MSLRGLLPWFACFVLCEAQGQKSIFKTYTVSDGLVTNSVRKIFQDSKGFIWICSWEGLSRYDGDQFTNYTKANGLSDNNVNDVIESDDGKIFVALNTGFTDVIQNGVITDHGFFKHVVINRFFRSADNRVFAVTDTSGIWEIRNDKIFKHDQDDPHSSYSRMISLSDSLYLVASPQIPYRILDKNFRIVGDKTPANRMIYECLFQDSRRRVWMGTEKGLQLFTCSNDLKETFVQISIPFRSALPAKMPIVPSDVLEEKDGNIWLATAGGLINLRPDGSYQLLTQTDGLPSNQLLCLFQDREKNIWIGSTLGLTKLIRRNHIEIFTSDDGIKQNNIDKIFVGQNPKAIYIGCSNSSLQEFRISLHEITESDFTRRIQSLFSHLSILPSIRDLKKVTPTLVSILKRFSGKQAGYCETFSDEKVFIGGSGALVVGTIDKILVDSTFQFRITNMLVDSKGYLWIGTWENGLFRIPAQDYDKPVRSFENLTTLLPGKHIRSLFEDHNGNIWVGFRHDGLARLERKKSGFDVRAIDQRSGLSSNFIRAINEDASGNILIGSMVGLDKLVWENGRFRIFNLSRINNLFAPINDIYCQPSGDIWCASTEGLVHFEDENLENFAPLPVVFTAVYLGGARYVAPASSQLPVLPYVGNTANFQFTSLGFINEKQLQYSYRLLGGTDTNWSVAANMHAVSFASLQPGTYRFEVRSLGWNGAFGDPSSFQFKILPPYWRSWWFFASILVITVILMYILYRYRINQLLQIQKVRNRLATDLHDDIGSTLTNISILSELGRKHLQQPNQTVQFLERITEEVNASSQALDDIIWSVNTRNDTMQETLARMRRYAAELFDSTGVNCHIELEDTVNGMKISMEQRRDLYLIYKESLNNIYKHASALQVWINAKTDHHHFKLSIRDDGKGFIPAPNNRHGLKNLKWRVERWNGEFKVESAAGKGTVIEVTIPLHA